MSQNPTPFTIGDDLYGVSIAELKARVTALQLEMQRIEGFLELKEAELKAADNIFNSN